MEEVQQQQQAVRTFVFVSNVPPSVSSSDALKTLLRATTTRCMQALLLDEGGYGLALFASLEDALQACKSEIAADDAILLLRIVKRDTKPQVEMAYTHKIVVEGETVEKDTLAVTKGLSDAYRGIAPAKWCRATQANEDCPIGVQCRFVHRAACQQTVKRRRDVDSGVAHHHGDGDASHAAAHFTLKDLEELVPPSLRQKAVFVQLSIDEADSLANGVSVAAVVQRLDSAIRSGAVACPVFAKIDVPNAAPWEWCLHCDSGLRQLREACPLPANGAPTPLERDAFIQRMLVSMNQLCAFANAADAVAAIAASARSRTAMEAHAADGSDRSSARMRLAVVEWLPVQSLLAEVNIFVRDSRVVGVTQWHESVRYITSSGGAAQPETISQDRAEKQIQKCCTELTQWLSSPSCPRQNVTCCFHAVLAPNERTVITSAHSFAHFAAESALLPQQPSTKPVWNTQKHLFVPLFSRETLAKLAPLAS